MAPPKYKLTYFDSRRYMEPARFMFALKEVEYEDVRITKDNWPELKPKTPFGKLPFFEVDGQVLAQSIAINRFIAKELGMYGKSRLEKATIDMYVDAVKDFFRGQVYPFLTETDPEKKEEEIEKFFMETLPPFLEKWENFLKKNGGKHYVGEELTWADISLAVALNELRNHNAEIYKKYPLVSKHIDYVHGISQIKAWIDKRPKTQY